MARNKGGLTDLDGGLFKSRTAETPASQPEQPAVADLSLLYTPPEQEAHRPLGVTQGRKGQKAKRITMSFSDDNHAYITFESRRRGMNATQFVNMVLDLYRESPDGHVD